MVDPLLTACGICCIYPILFHLLMLWLAKQNKRIDWQNINWKFWRREQ